MTDPISSSLGTPAPTPVPGTTVVQPVPPVNPAVPANPSTPIPGGGQPTPPPTGAWGQFFRQVSWVEVGFMVLSTAALLFLIRYYRYRLYADKEATKKLQFDMDEVQAKIAEMQTKAKKPQRVAGF